MKALQLFTDKTLEQSRQLSSLEILIFLEEFRLLHGQHEATSDLEDTDKLTPTLSVSGL